MVHIHVPSNCTKHKKLTFICNFWSKNWNKIFKELSRTVNPKMWKKSSIFGSIFKQNKIEIFTERIFRAFTQKDTVYLQETLEWRSQVKNFQNPDMLSAHLTNGELISCLMRSYKNYFCVRIYSHCFIIALIFQKNQKYGFLYKIS